MRRDIDRGTLGVDPTLDAKGQDDYIKMISGYTKDAIRQERRFLDATGIRDDALVYGVIGFDFEVDWLPIYFFDGWTFSIEDMAKLGIENVTYNGEGTYPDRREALVRHVKIFKVP